MGIGLISKWVCPVHSPLHTHSSTKQHFSPVKGREVFFDPIRVSSLSVIPEESETLCTDTLRAYTCSLGALQIVENGSLDMEEKKMNFAKGSHKTMFYPADTTTLLSRKTSHLSLFMENVGRIEDSFVDADYIRLERDILTQLGKLGALKLFRACLSRTLKTPNVLSSSRSLVDLPRASQTNAAIDDRVHNVVIQSGKKEERKLKRERASEKAAKISVMSLKTSTKVSRQYSASTAKYASNPRNRRLIIARNESEMSSGVKEVANLERIRSSLESEIGRVATFGSWSEAAGIDEETLKERLQFGWFCRDKLLRSTRSLVKYLARNYRGLGVSFDDLLQAGKMGVLQGAERFDPTRGYQFSTYVQYWIRKSMSTLVARHSRGIQLPVTLTRVINQIRKARSAFHNMHGRYPDDDEISRFTGLSLAKIRSASKCPRVVGSIDQRMGDNLTLKFMEFTPDTLIKTPKESVIRQHLQKDIYELLQGLHPREKQVLALRYGLWDGQCKSLSETGRLFKCTKEWIWKIEKTALTKLRKEEVQTYFAYYLNL